MTHLLLKFKRGIHRHWSKMIHPLETKVGFSEIISVGRLATGLFFVIQTLFLSGCKDTGGQVIGYVNGVLNRATLSSSPSSVTLNEGLSTTVTIRFSHPITKATTLDWSVNATTSEFSEVSGTITVPLDAQSVTLTLNSVDNAMADGTRAYTLSVSGSIVDFVNDLSLNLSILDDESATSMTWNFATTGDYTYDTNYIDLSSGTKASLKTVNTTFNDSSTFNSGTHVGTAYSGGVLKLNSQVAFELGSAWTPQWSSLVAYWKLNEVSGSVASDSKGSYSATINGSVTVGSSGKVDKAMYFPGTATAYLSTSSAPSLTDHFTIATWIKLSSLTAWSRIIRLGNSYPSGESFAIQVNASGGISNYVYWSDGTNNGVTTSAISTGQWYQVVTTYDGATLSFYLDGVLASSTSVSGKSIRNPDINSVYFSGSSNPFNGYVDDTAVWTTALTATEVKTLYYGQSSQYLNELSPTWTPKWSNLVGYWKMDGSWLDSSGNYSAGTGTNSPTFSATAKIGSQSGSFVSASSQSVALGDVTQLNGVSKFTMVGWCRFTSLVDNMKCISKYSGANDRISIGLSQAGAGSNDDWSLVLGNSTLAYGYTNSGLVATGVWYHFALVFDGSQSTNENRLILYINGEQKTLTFVGTIPATTSSSLSGTQLTLSRANAGEYMNGFIDDVGIFNTTLSASDIALIYNRQKQKYAGSYDSPIIDMGASGATLTSLASVSSLPFYKELPGGSGSEGSSHYSSINGGLMSGLVGLWPLNESSGTTFSDVSGVATTTDGACTNCPIHGQKGALGLAPSFSGTNQKISIPHQAKLGTSSTFTYSAWVKTTATTHCPIVFRSMDTNAVPHNGNLARLWIRTTGLPHILIYDTSSNLREAQGSTTVNDGRWHLITGTFNQSSSELILYVDGKQTATATAPNNIAAATNVTYIGGEISGTYYCNGSIDEVAIWSRALSAAEVLELYRRGANRVKYQARSCVDGSCACKAYSTSPAGSASDCDGDGIPNSSDTSDSYAADWIGPDGTASTYFSELQNNTSVDASGNPTGSVSTTGLTLDWSGSFFTAAARPTANRYFQYRVYMESDDENNLCSGSPCMPEVTSITVGPTGRYYGGSPTVVNNTALSFNQLQTMTRSDTGSCTTYQLSTDGGSTWKWWDGSAWAATSGGVSSSNYLSDFTTPRLQSLSGGNYKFKAFLNTNTSGDFTQSCDLNSVGVTYTP
jgi:hypothetical protein